ncbi:MAG: hypothetical protein EON54_06355 [Alcaligenaceae bacterium]|uniref:hypothetical protein n=1 Tax=Tardiphaga sp. 172_B4_N1_3 TaxID=3240787 RepID=UPI0010F40CE4|nr:MAG: hypothetical protein EON54_06355 [Alcaligenaceae bacterium]
MKATTWLRDLAATIASDTFAICLLAAVLAAAVLAFGLGAEADLIITILIVGVATAFAETTMRARNDKGNPK